MEKINSKENENRENLLKPGVIYKILPIDSTQYDLACRSSEWIKNQEDKDFIKECVNGFWYHKVSFGKYSPKTRGWDMFKYLKAHYPIHLVNGKKVLDLGCSDGMGSACLEESGAKVVAVDLFDKSINHANLVKRYFNYNFKIEKADALGDLSNLGKFDILFCSNLICHISEKDQVNTLSKKEWLEKVKDIAPIMIFATNDNEVDVPLLKEFGCELYSQYVSQDNQTIYVMLKK